ncbi:hypothetical protein BAZO_00840 [Schinkia azotoformans LMG 9581]|uniref:Restriction endonuclease domain-containing protein n=1 Tax=Schinkia azotoformans LMG 9581 TaxID=1131731 RepID=K6CI06_SCHAZ|nr:hypothetical protein BAZO_00840 [Schinkia azotoformans LMG 9581]
MKEYWIVDPYYQTIEVYLLKTEHITAVEFILKMIFYMFTYLEIFKSN